MHCTNCGTALSADTSFCANCGTPKGAPAATQAQPVVVNNNPYVQAAPATGSPNSMAVAALVVALATLLLCGGTLSFVGAILGHVALGQIKRTGQPGRGLAIGAIATGWAVTGLWLIFALIVGVAAASSSSYYY
ncbi:MAG: hypothetical protein RLZ71_981 [Actinomycetota bacterium]|jgi:hypothetical protein